MHQTTTAEIGGGLRGGGLNRLSLLPVTARFEVVFHKLYTHENSAKRIRRFLKNVGFPGGIICYTAIDGYYVAFALRTRVYLAMLRPYFEAWSEQNGVMVAKPVRALSGIPKKMLAEVSGVLLAWGPKRWYTVGGVPVYGAAASNQDIPIRPESCAVREAGCAGFENGNRKGASDAIAAPG